MKSTGIIRKVDELGRIVIPMELRNKLKIEEKDPMEIYVEGSSIVLKKVDDSCILCGNNKNVLIYNKRSICKNCIKKISNLTNELDNPLTPPNK